MRRFISVAAFLTVFAFVPLTAQDDGPTVTTVNYIEVLDARYYTYIREVLFPVWEEFVEMGLIVSYDFLRPGAGVEGIDFVGVTQYPNWDGVNDLTTDAYNEASQAAHGMPWAEANAEYRPLSELRSIIRNEVYRSIKP